MGSEGKGWENKKSFSVISVCNLSLFANIFIRFSGSFIEKTRYLMSLYKSTNKFVKNKKFNITIKKNKALIY